MFLAPRGKATAKRSDFQRLLHAHGTDSPFPVPRPPHGPGTRSGPGPGSAFPSLRRWRRQPRDAPRAQPRVRTGCSRLGAGDRESPQAATASGATGRASAGEPEHRAPTAAAAVRKGRAGRGTAGPSPGSSAATGGSARPSASGGAGCGSAMGKKHKKHKAEKAEWRSTSATAYSGEGRGGLFVPGTRPPLPPARLSAGPGVPARAGGWGLGQRPCSECWSCRRWGRPGERGPGGAVRARASPCIHGCSSGDPAAAVLEGCLISPCSARTLRPFQRRPKNQFHVSCRFGEHHNLRSAERLFVSLDMLVLAVVFLSRCIVCIFDLQLILINNSSRRSFGAGGG